MSREGRRTMEKVLENTVRDRLTSSSAWWSLHSSIMTTPLWIITYYLYQMNDTLPNQPLYQFVSSSLWHGYDITYLTFLEHRFTPASNILLLLSTEKGERYPNYLLFTVDFNFFLFFALGSSDFALPFPERIPPWKMDRSQVGYSLGDFGQSWTVVES